MGLFGPDWGTPDQNGWSKDWHGDWWKPSAEMKVDRDMRFPFYTNDVDKTVYDAIGVNPPWMKHFEGYAWVNPGSELSRPWGTMVMKPDASDFIRDHEDHHLDGYVHPGVEELMNYLANLQKQALNR